MSSNSDLIYAIDHIESEVKRLESILECDALVALRCDRMADEDRKLVVEEHRRLKNGLCMLKRLFVDGEKL